MFSQVYDPASDRLGFVTYPYLQTGTEYIGNGDSYIQYDGSGASLNPDYLPPTVPAEFRETGATWGTAYRRSNRLIITSAVLRRHSSLGPSGEGALYAIDPVTHTVSLLADLAAAPHNINLGSVDRTGPNALTAGQVLSVDGDAYAKIGKIAVGGLDLSADESTLWAVNLAERTLLSIDLGQANTAPVVGAINSTDIVAGFQSTGKSCTNGEVRPWAVKVIDGLIHVGVTCSAENGGTMADLISHVLTYSPDTTTWAHVLEMSMDYARGCATQGGGASGGCSWTTWSDDFSEVGIASNGTNTLRPQPILGSLEKDNDGSLILAFIDRHGFQVGNLNHPPTGITGTEYATVTAGDLIRACSTGAAYDIDVHTTACTPTPTNASVVFAMNSLRNGTEFYWQDSYDSHFEGTGHQETARGGLGMLHGSGEVMATIMDPMTTMWDDGSSWSSSGTMRFSNKDGSGGGEWEAPRPYTIGLVNGYGIFSYFGWLADPTGIQYGGSFQKSGALGDLVLLCDEAPLEVGNVVWLDTDADGIQDPTEAGIKGVQMELWSDPDGTPGNGDEVLVDTTTTDTSGEYYFNADILSDYYIAAKTTDPSLSGLELTLQDYATDATGTDGHDSDGVLNTTLNKIIIPFTTGNAGENNYTYDMGFTPAPPLGVIGNYVWLDENSDGRQDEGEPGIPNVFVTLQLSDGSGPVYTTTTDAQGGYLFTDLPQGTYTVTVPATNQTSGGTLEGKQQTPIDTTTNDFGNKDETGYKVTIGNGQPLENLTADFGYNYNPTSDVDGDTGLAALGDRIWIDSNGNGATDTGEIGVANAELTLYSDPDGNGVYDTVQGTTTTDNNGYYLFDDLAAGGYIVTVTNSATASHDILGADYIQTGDPDHFGTTGANNDHATSDPVVLSPGDVFLNVDFGYQPQGAPLGSIGDTVWFDADTDGNGPDLSAVDGGATLTQGAGGTADGSDYGIHGVTVTLIADMNGNGIWDAAEPILATDLTDKNGQYLFSGLSLDDGDGDADYLVWVNDTHNVLSELMPTYDSNQLTPSAGMAQGLGISAVALDSTTPDDRMQDFGYTAQKRLPGSIGDTVWLDVDNSGDNQNNQGTEPGIADISLFLYQDADADGMADDINGDGVSDTSDAISTTTTNTEGYYLFDNLPLGSYVVAVDSSSLPASLNPTATYEADGDTDGFGETVILTESMTNNLSQDFSYTYADTTLGSIGDQIWGDLDNSGTDQPTTGDTLLSGVRVTLTDATGAVIQTTRTDASGTYLFAGLAAGDYTISVDTSTLPDIYTALPTYDPDSTNDSSSSYSLGAGEHNHTQDFSYPLRNSLYSIGDTVWFDVDSSGGDQSTKQAEPGLADVKVELYGPTAVTHTNAALAGTVTSAGDCACDEIGASSLIDGDTTSAWPDAWAGYVATAWAQIDLGSVQEIDYITLRPMDGDGMYNSLTLLVSDTPFTDYSSLGAMKAQADFVSAVTGGWTLDPISYPVDKPGRYVVLYTDTGDWEGWYSMGEVEVYVPTVSETGLIATTYTNESGQYLFDDLPYSGDYTVVVDTSTLPPYVSQLSTHDGTDGGTDSISVSTLDLTMPNRRDQDFSYPPTTVRYGAIGDTVWFDADASGDAAQGAGESGIEGVLVTLTNENGQVISTMTDENGHYYFGDLPLDADYTVTIAAENFAAGAVLEGFNDTYDPDGGSDNTSTTTLSFLNPYDMDQDFSYSGNAGSIGNRVWLDQNANGIWETDNGPDGVGGTDDDETGLAGVTIDLYRDLNANGMLDPGEPRLATKTTDPSGMYLFEMLPLGNYVVDVTDTGDVLLGYWHSLGAQDATTNSGNDAADQSKADPFAVTIDAGVPDNMNVDFGFYVEPAAVGNYVWVDTNNNGLQDDGETGINGIQVKLEITSPDGTVANLLALTKDDEAGNPGYYSFRNLLTDEDQNGDGMGPEAVHVISVDVEQSGLAAYAPTQVDVAEATADSDDSDDHTGVTAMPVQGLWNTMATDPVTNEAQVAGYDFGFVNPVVDLELTKAVDQSLVSRGDTVTYTITASNKGPANGTEIVVTDILPDALEYISSTPSQGTYDPATGNWAMGTLPNGAEATLAITVKVK